MMCFFHPKTVFTFSGKEVRLVRQDLYLDDPLGRCWFPSKPSIRGSFKHIYSVTLNISSQVRASGVYDESKRGFDGT